MIKTLQILILKDIRCELRGREFITLQILTSLLATLVVAAGLSGAFVSHETIIRLYPIFLWTIFVFAAAISFMRCFEYEMTLGAIDGLITSGISPTVVYTAKVLFAWMILALGILISALILAAVLNITLSPSAMLNLFFIIILAAFGYSALATILSAITVSSRQKGVLLPLLTIALVFPLIFAALELTFGVVFEHSILEEPFWLLLLVVFDLVYFILGAGLFNDAIKE